MGCFSSKAQKSVPKNNVSASRKQIGVTSMQDALKLQKSRYVTYDEIKKLDFQIRDETSQPIRIQNFDYNTKTVTR